MPESPARVPPPLSAPPLPESALPKQPPHISLFSFQIPLKVFETAGVLGIVLVSLALVYLTGGSAKGLLVFAGILGAAIVLPAILAKPWLGYALIALLIPFEDFQVLPLVGLTASKIIGVYLVAVTSLHLLSGGIKGLRSSPVDAPLAVYLVLAGLSLIGCEDLGTGVVQYISLLSYAALFYLGGTLLDTRPRLIAVAAVFCGAIAIVSGYTALVEMGVGIAPVELDKVSLIGGQMVYRYAGTSHNAALFVTYPILGAALALGFWRMNPPRWARILLIAALAIFALKIYFSYTRSAYLALAAMLTAYSWLFAKRKAFAIFAFVACVMAAVFYIPSFITEHFRSGFTLQEESARMRLLQYQGAWDLFQDNWLFGIGVNNSPARLIGRKVGYDLLENVVHSLPITILLETGVLGFAAFLWLAAAGMLRFYRSFSQAHDPVLKGILAAGLLGCLGYLIHNLFHCLLYMSIVGLMPGLALAAWNQNQDVDVKFRQEEAGQSR